LLASSWLLFYLLLLFLSYPFALLFYSLLCFDLSVALSFILLGSFFSLFFVRLLLLFYLSRADACPSDLFFSYPLFISCILLFVLSRLLLHELKSKKAKELMHPRTDALSDAADFLGLAWQVSVVVVEMHRPSMSASM